MSEGHMAHWKEQMLCSHQVYITILTVKISGTILKLLEIQFLKDNDMSLMVLI